MPSNHSCLELELNCITCSLGGSDNNTASDSPYLCLLIAFCKHPPWVVQLLTSHVKPPDLGKSYRANVRAWVCISALNLGSLVWSQAPGHCEDVDPLHRQRGALKHELFRWSWLMELQALPGKVTGCLGSATLLHGPCCMGRFTFVHSLGSEEILQHHG